METAISQFTYLPQTKAERETFVKMAVEEVLNGERNPLELEVMLKNLEDTISAIRKVTEFKSAVLDEAQKYSEKSFTYKNVTITKTNRSTYDFSVCGDSVYNQLQIELEGLKTAVKERETFLKSIKPGIEVADTETGEVINPPAVSTTEFLTIKLP